MSKVVMYSWTCLVDNGIKKEPPQHKLELFSTEKFKSGLKVFRNKFSKPNQKFCLNFKIS